MPTQINEIPKVFQHGETLESSELNAIISQVNSAIRKINTVEANLDNHEYDVSIPITNIYCRTKKGINAISFFPQADAKRDELLDQVSNCSTTQGIKYNTTFSTVTLSENADLMNGVWTSYPQGVNESLPHEWEVSYKKLTDNSIIYMFGPVLRSNYGYSGADGDGVQYVYRLFNHELSDIERTNNTPVRPENPNSNGEFIPYGWSDEPLGPTSDYPYEYVATLKRTNSSWGSFEKISLWSIYTEDGTNGDYYARAFCRFIPTDNKLTPNRPIGGTYENPQPGSNDNIQWSLTIPAEDNNNKGPIWTSIRIFKGNNQNTQWSIPVVEADSAELDIEYSSQVEKPDPDTTLRTVPNTANPSNIWHDPSEANIDLSTMIWRAERKIKNGQYDGNWVITRIAGVKGKDGEDGWMITANPANVIITQALGNDTTQFSTVKVGFTAKKGNVAATISSLDIPIGQQALSAEFNATIGTGNDAKKVIVNSPKTYTPQGGTAQYYTEGTFEVVVNVTDPDTGSGVTFNVTVPCYANLLGTWSEEVVGDAKTEVAKSLSYAYDPSGHNVISLENLGKFIKSSTQDTSELRQKVCVDILNLTYPATSSDIDEMTVNVLAGTYKVAGEFNLVNLPTGNGYLTFVGPGVDKTWDLTGGLVDSIDDEVTFTSAGVLTINTGDDVSSGNDYDILNLAIYQSQDKIAKLELTADGLTSDVNAIKAGKNLLTLTSRWEGYGGAAVNYDQNFGVWDENSDLYSPFIRLAEGQRVCFSAYMSSYAAQSGNWYIGYGSTPPVHLSDLYDNAHIPIALTRKPGDSITVDGTAYDRYYYVLNAGTVFVDQYITFNFTGLYKLFCPQLENGNAPTAFTAGSIETSSQIKQTADAITLVVQQGYATKSELQITTDGITAEVNAIKAGKNLFSDALTGAEWYSESSIPFANHPGMTYVTVDDNGYFIPNTGHNCIAKTVTLEKGKWYVVSVELKTSTNLPFAVFNGNTYYVNQGGYLSPISSGSKRVATKFKYDDGTTGTYTCFIGFDVSNLGNNKALRYPQLEIGDTATAFDAGDKEVSSRIKQTVDSINLETGVSESTLNKAGLYITAGTPADNTTNPPTPAVPSKVRIKAGQFEVFTPADTQNNVPEKIIFGNDANTDTMVFYGDVKTGSLITNDVYNRRMNEINADGTGNLGGRLIDWDPNPNYGGLYIGPGPEDITLSSLTYLNSGQSDAHYNGDGIRVFPDGTIHFQGEMDGDFHFGKIKIHGSDGTLECKWFNMQKDEYFSGQSNTRGISTHIDKDNGMYIKLQTTGSDDVIESSTHTFHSNVDWGSIGFGTSNILGGAGVIGQGGSLNGGDSNLDPSMGIYIKGKDGKTYKGYTGRIQYGNNYLYFINGIMIGTYSNTLDTALWYNG